jgi:hypothetical protein
MKVIFYFVVTLGGSVISLRREYELNENSTLTELAKMRTCAKEQVGREYKTSLVEYKYMDVL